MINPNDTHNYSKDTTISMVKILAKQKKGLSFCHINAQSLNNKMAEFRLVFENSGVDIICVSETWFTESTPDSLARLSGYKIYRSDRAGHAGGVAIYIKNHITSIFLCKSGNESKIEYIFVEIISSGRKMLVGCAYRPRRTVQFTDLFSELETITVAYNDVLIAGDLNSNILNETTLTDFMSSLNLLPTNTSTPTHFSSSINTLLDLFFVSHTNKVLLYDQIPACCFSKHDLIFLSYDFFITEKDQKYTYRDFKNLNYNLLFENFHQVDWDNIFRIDSVDNQLSFIENNIHQLFDETVPLKTKIIAAKDKPWFSTFIKRHILLRDLAYSRWKRFKTDDLKAEYKAARNTVTLHIRRAKSSYYSNQFSSALESKKTWKIISDIGIGKQSTSGMCTADADDLNKGFTNIPMVPINTAFYSTLINSSTAPNPDSFEFSGVTQNEVFAAFSSVKSNAIGCDNIHPRFIKILLPLILPYITHLFNTIITKSYFPTKWKFAKIIPIPKSNTGFRPIAILPFLSKVLEKLLYAQMSNYISDKSLLTDKQSGFRPKHSCITALVQVSEDLRRELDDGKVIFLVLLDHSNAFDTVDHKLLCMKLKHFFNFSSSSCNLLSSYLTGRTQSVFSNNKMSQPLSLTRGVPQGSILGPLLFAIYANDLPQQLSFSNIHMYADDAQLYLSSPAKLLKENIEKLNLDLNSIYCWATANGLCLNPQKSKCIIIRKNSANISVENHISINGQQIQIVNSAKNLGIIFNSNLTWSNHINALVGQTYVKLRSLWSTHYLIPLKIRSLLAKTYLVPGLIYGCELFSKCDSESQRKLNVLYNNIVRYVYGLRRFDHISAYASSLFGVSFESLLKIKTLTLMHKIIYTGKPQYLYSQIRLARSPRGKRLIIPKHRCLVSEWQFHVKAARLWNTLPHSLQLNSNAEHFKKLLFQFFT